MQGGAAVILLRSTERAMYVRVWHWHFGEGDGTWDEERLGA